jgi:hypothetical protein
MKSICIIFFVLNNIFRVKILQKRTFHMNEVVVEISEDYIFVTKPNILIQ